MVNEIKSSSPFSVSVSVSSSGKFPYHYCVTTYKKLQVELNKEVIYRFNIKYKKVKVTNSQTSEKTKLFFIDGRFVRTEY